MPWGYTILKLKFTWKQYEQRPHPLPNWISMLQKPAGWPALYFWTTVKETGGDTFQTICGVFWHSAGNLPCIGKSLSKRQKQAESRHRSKERGTPRKATQGRSQPGSTTENRNLWDCRYTNMLFRMCILWCSTNIILHFQNTCFTLSEGNQWWSVVWIICFRDKHACLSVTDGTRKQMLVLLASVVCMWKLHQLLWSPPVSYS